MYTPAGVLPLTVTLPVAGFNTGAFGVVGVWVTLIVTFPPVPAVAEPVPTLSLVNILPITPGTTLLVVVVAVKLSAVTVGVTFATVIVVVPVTQLVGVAVVHTW